MAPTITWRLVLRLALFGIVLGLDGEKLTGPYQMKGPTTVPEGPSIAQAHAETPHYPQGQSAIDVDTISDKNTNLQKLLDDEIIPGSQLSTQYTCMTHTPHKFVAADNRCKSKFHGTCRRGCRADETMIKDLSCLSFESKCMCCSNNAPKTEICKEGKQCECRKGFFKVDMQCVMFDQNSYSWEAAQRSCQQHNASLGQIESFEKLVRPMKYNEIPEGEYWLGITLSGTLEYTWFNDKGTVSGPWASEQPDTSLKCVVMCWRESNLAQLCSRSCTRSTNFVCTYDIIPWVADAGSDSCQIGPTISVIIGFIFSFYQLIIYL